MDVDQLHDLLAAIAPSSGTVVVHHEGTTALRAGRREVAADDPVHLADCVRRAATEGEVVVELDLDGEAQTLRFSRVLLGDEVLVVGVPTGDPAPSAASRDVAMTACLAELQAARRRLEQLADHVVHGVDHAHRTPLTVILGFAHTLRTRWPELSAEDLELLLDGLDRQALRLEATLARLHVLGRRPGGVARDVVEVDDVLDAGRRAATLPGDERVLVVPSRLRARVAADLVRLLVAELVDNALRRGDATRVRVEATNRDRDIGIEVIDDGHGLLDPDAAVLPFVGAPDGSTAGLGLALARHVATLHGGEVAVERAPGGGTRVVATLPDCRV